MVDDLNKVMLEINSQTKYDPATKKAGPLLDSSAVRQVRQLISEAISGSSGSTSVALAGISLTRNGTVEFDRAKFIEAFTKDPTATQALFNDGPVAGIGKRVYDVADRATNLDSGLLVSAQDTLKATMDALQISIDGMQQRLDKRAISLRAQFNAMETTLSSLKSQGSWLTSQLG
jgi:flagellar hook-associated protein 2